MTSHSKIMLRLILIHFSLFTWCVDAIELSDLSPKERTELKESKYKKNTHRFNYWRAIGIGATLGTIAYVAAPEPSENKIINLGMFLSIGFGGSIAYDAYYHEPRIIDELKEREKQKILNAIP